MNLTELEAFIKTNKHLPNIPSEKDVLSNGIDIAEMQAAQLQKIEELTLYILSINKELENQRIVIAEQQNQIEAIKNSVVNSK
jgi:hypothetical protein